LPEQPPSGAEWAEILTSMERELARLQQEPAAAAVPWTVPAAAGPIPPELADRARALAAAQRDVAGELERERAATARHLSALRSIPGVAARGGAVYLDVTG
jgi:hypothetical protein